MKCRLLLVATLVLLTDGATAMAKYRVWTDGRGQKVNAEFVRMNGEEVVLKNRANHKNLSIPFENLSEPDQDFLRELLESQGKGDQVPAKKPPAAPGSGLPGSGGPGAAAPAGPGAGPFNPPAGSPYGPTSAPPMPPGGPFVPPGGAPMPPTGQPGQPPAGPFNGPPGGPAQMPPGGPGMPPGMPGPQNMNNAPPMGPMGGPMGPGINMPGMNGPAGGPPMGGVPQMEFVQTKNCMKCGKEVPASSKAGDKCPHCGVIWGYEQGADGKRTYSTAYQVTGGAMAMFAVVGVVIAVIRKLKG